MVKKQFTAKFAMIGKDQKIHLFSQTKISYNLRDMVFILKDVMVELNDDHIIYIKGTPAQKHFTEDPLYIDTMTDEVLANLLPQKERRKTIFKHREFIIGSYATWQDHQMEMYLKLDPYGIIIEP